MLFVDGENCTLGVQPGGCRVREVLCAASSGAGQGREVKAKSLHSRTVARTAHLLNTILP